MAARTPTDEELAYLKLLANGMEFNEACGKVGNGLQGDGLRIAFQCISAGWVNRGVITPAGRAIVQSKPGKADFEVIDLTTGKKL